MALAEFTTGAEQLAFYKLIRKRNWSGAPQKPAPNESGRIQDVPIPPALPTPTPRGPDGQFTRYHAEVVDIGLERLVRAAAALARDPCVRVVDPAPLNLPVRVIGTVVANFYGATWRDMTSSRRPAALFHPRHVGMYLGCELTKRSYPQIGRLFGGRDHTTVLHAHRKIAALLKTDARLRDEIDLLTMRLIELDQSQQAMEAPHELNKHT